MAKVNKTRFAMLGMLASGPCSGYDIKKRCDGSIAHFWNENYAHIYPVLKDLEKEGLVTKESEQQAGRPAKNVYTITSAGQETLRKWLLEPVDGVAVRNEFLLKLFFSTELKNSEIIASIEYQKNKIEELKVVFEQRKAMIENMEELREHPQKRFWLLSLNYGIYDAEAVLKWCDEAIAQFREAS